MSTWKSTVSMRLMAPRHLPLGPGGDQRREAPIRGDRTGRRSGTARTAEPAWVGFTAGAADPDRRPGAEAVPPMALPDPGPLLSAASLERFGAVRLFLELGPGGASRLRRRRPERAGDVVAICRRLDGLPLAIELAAARITIFPLQRRPAGCSRPACEKHYASRRWRSARCSGRCERLGDRGGEQRRPGPGRRVEQDLDQPVRSQIPADRSLVAPVPGAEAPPGCAPPG